MALLFCTARRRNGFAALQDLLTRTRVTRKTAHGARPGLEAAKDRPAAAGSAPQLGPYHALETLGRRGAEETLPTNPNLEVLALTLEHPATIVDLSATTFPCS
jgi:hypothetical protein